MAALITDISLKRVLLPEQDIRLAEGQMLSPWVEQNLPDLVMACRSSEAVDVDEADRRLATYIDGFVGPPAEKKSQRPIMAGNSIHADWGLIRRFLPNFLHRLHYRHLDVTAFKVEWQSIHPDTEFEKENPEIIAHYFPEALLADSNSLHDAYYDLQASIAELAFYRQHLFLPT
jgi:oligoribonuclease